MPRGKLRFAAGRRWIWRSSKTRDIDRRVWYDTDVDREYERDPSPEKRTWHEIDWQRRQYREVDPDTGQPVTGSEGQWRQLRSEATERRRLCRGDGGNVVTKHDLKAGTRVRLRSSSHVVELRASTGTIKRPDQLQDYYVIRLDQPALYLNVDGTTRDLPEIVETIDDFDVLSDLSGTP